MGGWEDGKMGMEVKAYGRRYCGPSPCDGGYNWCVVTRKSWDLYFLSQDPLEFPGGDGELDSWPMLPRLECIRYGGPGQRFVAEPYRRRGHSIVLVKQRFAYDC